MPRLLAIVCFSAVGASAFTPTAVPMRAATRSSSSPVMSEESVATRRAVLASLIAAAPLSASAMTIPGLNAPGLVKAKTVPKADAHGYSGAAFETIRDAGTNHFWSNKGIMNSVPKMKGIITPKSAINGGL